ncbi:hypothetical protein ACIA8B_28145 [Micromonospora chalcea]
MNVTAILAAYGAAVATGSLVVAILAFRAGAPRLRVSTSTLLRSTFEPREIMVDAHNRGRSAITVLDIGMWFVPGERGTIEAFKIHEYCITGPDLPTRLEGHSSARWIISSPLLGPGNARYFFPVWRNPVGGKWRIIVTSPDRKIAIEERADLLPEIRDEDRSFRDSMRAGLQDDDLYLQMFEPTEYIRRRDKVDDEGDGP